MHDLDCLRPGGLGKARPPPGGVWAVLEGTARAGHQAQPKCNTACAHPPIHPWARCVQRTPRPLRSTGLKEPGTPGGRSPNGPLAFFSPPACA
eukprot:11618691-Karenia_brevis.AAC.1